MPQKLFCLYKYKMIQFCLSFVIIKITLVSDHQSSQVEGWGPVSLVTGSGGGGTARFGRQVDNNKNTNGWVGLSSPLLIQNKNKNDLEQKNCRSLSGSFGGTDIRRNDR